MNTTMIKLLLAAAWSVAMFGAGWAWRGDRAERDVATQQGQAATAQAQAQADTRIQEHQQAQATQVASDSADAREEKINADYEARLTAALAGRDAELGRLRQLWAAKDATARLSSDAAAAAEAGEEDRLRRASAARIVRAVELAQSERNEAIDRYEAARFSREGVKP
ncbi:hypothetical protein [Pseudoxanthomonas sp. JBR18]|uniref:hypothetical protein n=1 Tax=Pseudoxanthomonas sp. JBR18 TaxID=2969308 RepID=UPI002306C8F3|nr:hypothetical protein [Pseudoxanthomonas sp. JBR18]WCE04438.1 hypothetical protein PJ250_00040 [Pseudoxanthomonas sp. JBR18]